MGSLTSTRKTKEKNRLTSMGKSRKRATREGTTPRFPVHVETAPDAELPRPPGSDPAEK